MGEASGSTQILLRFPGLRLLEGLRPPWTDATKGCPKHPKPTGKCPGEPSPCAQQAALSSHWPLEPSSSWLTFKLLFLSQAEPLLRWNQKSNKGRVSPGQRAGPREDEGAGGRGRLAPAPPSVCTPGPALSLSGQGTCDRLLRGGCRKGAQAACILPPSSKTTASLQQQGPVFHK